MKLKEIGHHVYEDERGFRYDLAGRYDDLDTYTATDGDHVAKIITDEHGDGLWVEDDDGDLHQVRGTCQYHVPDDDVILCRQLRRDLLGQRDEKEPDDLGEDLCPTDGRYSVDEVLEAISSDYEGDGFYDPNTKVYSCDDVLQEISTALGDFADDYDIGAIFDECYEQIDGSDSYVCVVDPDGFWDAAERHDVGARDGAEDD